MVWSVVEIGAAQKQKFLALQGRKKSCHGGGRCPAAISYPQFTVPVVSWGGYGCTSGLKYEK